jgi:Protein of unknown function (DUF2917)
MEQDFAQSLTRLARDEMLRVRHASGRCIVVFSGMAWVTQEGDPRDRLLTSGETFTLDRSGVALIHALEPTSLVVLDSDEALVAAKIDDRPVLAPVSRLQTSRSHVYRRARRLRAVAVQRWWRDFTSSVRAEWASLTGAGAARRVPPATRPLRARADQAA